MRALVSGASGHVGAFVARELLARGDEVVVLLRPSSDLWRLRDPFLGDVCDNVEVTRADFDDADQIRRAVALAQPDCVYHLAWEGITAERRDDASQVTRNAIRTLELLEAAHKCGCAAFVGVGSQAEYGALGPKRFAQEKSGAEEESVLIGRGDVGEWSAYGLSKLCVGLLQQKFCELAGMRGVWLRLLATYGPQDDPRHLLPSVINQLLRGEKPSLTPGEQRWDYLHVADGARAIVEAGHESGISGTFDLGSGQAPSVRELVERARDLVDASLPLGLGELPYRAGQVMHLQADLAPLQAQMKWAPEIALQKGLQQTVTWHRAQSQN